MGVPALDPAVQQDGQPNQGQEKKPPPEHQEHLLIGGKTLIFRDIKNTHIKQNSTLRQIVFINALGKRIICK
jgi:hypothetical protein